MKRIISFFVAIGMFLFVTAQSLSAGCWCDNWCPSCGPLRPCGWSVQAKAGWVPSHYTHRGSIWLTAPALTPSVFSVSKTPEFHKQFHQPWEVAGELAWNASQNVQFFVEGVYQKAKGKSHKFVTVPFTAKQEFGDFTVGGGYLGARYFVGPFCCRFSPFVGFKSGILHQSKTHNHFSILNASGVFVEIQKSHFFFSQWVPSVGAQIGFDLALWCNWSFVFTAEAVVTQGRKHNRNIVVTNPRLTGGITNVNIGDTGKIISFPITLGIKYSF